jgi:hypothetical protein
MWMLGFSKNQMTIYAIRYTKSFTLSKRLNFKNINMVNKLMYKIQIQILVLRHNIYQHMGIFPDMKIYYQDTL